MEQVEKNWKIGRLLSVRQQMIPFMNRKLPADLSTMRERIADNWVSVSNSIASFDDQAHDENTIFTLNWWPITKQSYWDQIIEAGKPVSPKEELEMRDLWE